MERLVSTAQACELLNLSLQGVHYRIKKGLLKSVKQDGKVYVFVDEENISKNTKDTNFNFQDDLRDFYHNEIMKLKDEEIELLKKTIDWIKEKYENEINRLEISQEKINKVFNDQITLLQKAFFEMKEVYKLTHTEPKQAQKYLGVKDFFIKMGQFGKSDFEIKQILIDRIKNGDKRFQYNKNTKEIRITFSDFEDLI